MEDWDYLKSDHSRAMNFSQSDLITNKHYEVEIKGGYEFLYQNFRILPEIGFHYRNQKKEATGGYLQYGSLDPSYGGYWSENLKKYDLVGTVITYEQQFFMPFLSLQAEYAFCENWRAKVFGRCFPSVRCDAIDMHNERMTQFNDFMEGGYGFSLGTEIQYKRVSLSFSYACTECTDGEYSQRNFGHTTYLSDSDSKLRAVYCFSDRKVRSAKEKYNLGGVVYDDGTVLHYSQIADYTGSAMPVAVIFSCHGGHFEESECVLGVGLEWSPALAFAKEGSLGERTNMLANKSLLVDQYFCEPEGIFANTGFLGLVDGRKTWQNIAYYDKNAKKSTADYPAFDYAVNYGKQHGFKKYAKGWYLPTVSEAYELAEYAAVVNRTLELLGYPPLELPIWTSSQDYDEKDIQYLVYMSNAEVSESPKHTEFTVCPIYCFSDGN